MVGRGKEKAVPLQQMLCCHLGVLGLGLGEGGLFFF